ncbi:hypothetical protein [Lysobacter firmicutimachus]|uniref:Lipoprotein n=1 Tax=Lysobacter firmicutimachus TaxID=1792846 RepID=A0ABU8D0A4_9GAMM
MTSKIRCQFLVLTALAVLPLCSCATLSGKVQEKRGALDGVKILSRSKFPPYTGYIKTWVVLGAMHDSRPVDFFYPYFEDGDPIPAEGDVCTISFHSELVSGQAGEKIVNEFSAKVVDDLRCK